MGGRAIQNARRVTVIEYHTLVDKVSALLRQTLPGVRFEVIPAYRAKPDFGDMDILVDRITLPPDWPQEVEAAFASKEVVANGPVRSFEFEGFQVDLITVKTMEFEFALGYFGWNDLGNLIGRIAHKYGFKFGHNGLFYPLRDGDYLVAEVRVTDEFAQAINFLGLDPDRWANGFDTLEEVFAFVASSALFDPAQFPLEHRSHRARVRDAKRPTYTAFLRWVKERNLSARNAAITAEEMLEAALQRFPAFREGLDEARAAQASRQVVKNRFNGRLVSEWTGLTGKGLGAFIADLKNVAGGPDALQSRVLESEPEEVRVWVQEQLARATASTAAY
ncbi:MAG: hypothetical protein WC997_17620 [Porticoccaceae bacterium]